MEDVVGVASRDTLLRPGVALVHLRAHTNLACMVYLSISIYLFIYVCMYVSIYIYLSIYLCMYVCIYLYRSIYRFLVQEYPLFTCERTPNQGLWFIYLYLSIYLSIYLYL